MSPPSSDRAPDTLLDVRGGTDRLGPFRLVRQLGRGGFAPVWLAEEVYDGKKLRDVAVKVFLVPDTIARGSAEEVRFHERIIDEARALCRVEHPNVVRFYSLQRDAASGVIGLVMEYVPGVSLDACLRAAGKLEDKEVIEIGIAVAWALSAVHNAGLVHRDVKPGNIVMGPTGFKLIDFGIVVDHAPEAAASASRAPPPPLVGTPGYIAPECIDLGVPSSPGSDLYALGATLFKLRFGDVPGPSLRPPSLPGDPLSKLVEQLLDRDPWARPRHADWVARELERLRTYAPPAPPLEQVVAHPDEPTVAETAPRSDLVPTRESDAPPPPALVPHPPLVGREEALAMLDRAAEEAKQGALRFVLIVGPLGIGRTRLLEAALARPFAGAGRVINARCSPERRSLLRPLVRGIEALPEGAAGGLGLLQDAIERALLPASIKGMTASDGALEGVEDALLWASADEPFLFVIDDIQWGDPYTLELLRLLVERAEAGAAGRLLVVAAARNEPSPGAPLRALLGQVRSKIRPGVKHIVLSPLSEGEASALLRGVSPLAPELVRAVVRSAGGVPFFLVHAILVWREKEAIAWGQGMWHAVDQRVLSEDVPGVAELVEARLGSCFDPASAEGRAALRALSAIAIYGGGLPIELVLRVAGDDDATESALWALSNAGILLVSGDPQEYSFAQEMVRQAALNLVRQRPWFCRLHRALLDALAEGPSAAADAAFLAAGYEKLGVREAARRWLSRAMEGAMGAGLFAEAAELGDRLAALTEDAEARAGLSLDVVRLLVRGRLFEEAKRRLAWLSARADVLPQEGGRALSLRRRILRLEAARGLSEAEMDDATLIEDADALGDPRIRCEARMALGGVLREERALDLASAAVALAEACGPSVEFAARVLRFELNYHSSRRDLPLAKLDLTRALAIATATGSIWRQIHIEGDLAALEAALGQLDEAIERLRRLVAQAEAHGMRWQLRLLSQNLAALLLRTGRDAEAAAVSKRTADLAAEAGDTALRARALSLRADVLVRLHELPEALSCVDEAERLQRERGDLMRALSLIRRAEILELMGRGAEALADARAARRLAEEQGDQDFAICALLWEKLRLMRRGAATGDEVREVLSLAAASGVTLRPLTLSLMKEARSAITG